MDYQKFKDMVFEAAQRKGLGAYELYYNKTQSTELGAFDGKVGAFSGSDDAAACFRCVCEGHIGSASTSLFVESEALSLVERAMENARSMEKEEPALFCAGGQHYEEVRPAVVEDMEVGALGEIALEELRLCKESDERVTDSGKTQVFIEHDTVCLDNSNGVHLENTTHLGAVMAQVITVQGEETSDAYELELGKPAEIDLARLAKETVQKALDGLGAEVPESGVCPLVLSPDAMRGMLSVFSAAFSAENAQNGLSLMNGKEGTVIASECVTLLDNPFYEKNLFCCPFDGEGTPARCKAVVENGVLLTLLHNLATAAKAGVESTGNGYRGSVDAPVSVKPNMLYFKPGEFTAEELYQKAGNGILVTEVGGLHAGADYVTGDFSLQSSGFLIRDGKKDRPVKSFTIAGNFYDMLKHITAVGNDLKTELSVYGSPSILIDEIAVGGK